MILLWQWSYTVSPPGQLIKFWSTLPRLEFNILDFVWGPLSCFVPEKSNTTSFTVHINFDCPTSPQPTDNPVQCQSFPTPKPFPRSTCKVTHTNKSLLKVARENWNCVPLGNYWTTISLLCNALLQLIHNEGWVLVVYTLHPERRKSFTTNSCLNNPLSLAGAVLYRVID